ncbi:MAG: minor capsid protein [Anaerovoracaceae bacterium]
MVPRLLEDVYQDGYYHSIFEFQKGLGIGFLVAAVDTRQLEKILSKPWTIDGKTFSDRIWTNKDKLIKELHDDITRATMLGRNPNELVKDFARKMETSKSNARRLIMTETSFFNSASHKDAFAELDIEEFEICATLDNKTSQLCRDLDGKHFPMKDYSVGLNAPPFHVYCRTTICPYFDDEFTADEVRIARDENGKNYKVPANMNYREWEKKFVKDKIDYMSFNYSPKFEKSGLVKVGDLKLHLKKVANSRFEMFADASFKLDNTAVVLTERNLREIANKLPDNFEMPNIAVIDFKKYGINENAIGGYEHIENWMFVNSRYDSPSKILRFVNREVGEFANVTEHGFYLHELGHKYYYDSIKLLENKTGLEYNKSKRKLDEAISGYIKNIKNTNEIFLEKRISGYASVGYERRKITELVAECFSVKENNLYAREVIKLIEREVE